VANDKRVTRSIPSATPRMPHTAKGNLLVFGGRRGKLAPCCIAASHFLLLLTRFYNKVNIFEILPFLELWISIFSFWTDFDIIQINKGRGNY
jgi:hypothetical protein